MDNGSILDKIIENKKNNSLATINPNQLVVDLFSVLNEREQEVLQKRFGLSGNQKHTLEKIGKGLGVTRERVRQVEISSIKKVKKHKRDSKVLKDLEDLAVQLLVDHSGIMAKHYLLNNLLQHVEPSDDNRTVLDFIISKLLNDRITSADDCNHFVSHWSLPDNNQEQAKQIVKDLVNLFEDSSEPLHVNSVREQYDASKQTALEAIEDHLLLTFLHVAKPVEQDIFGNWGLREWNTITPKRISDKIYIVLKQNKKPLHFTEISRLINDMKFDKKIAYPATVHNELILNTKYVLIGRGIYALSEWGYKPGVVADVVTKILEGNSPMTREEIVKKVLEQRIVGKSTIHLALMNKDRFRKEVNGSYELV